MDAHTIVQLDGELQEFMETIIAHKGKTYGATLSVWLTFIALERMHVQMIGELTGIVKTDMNLIPVLVTIPGLLDQTTQRLQAGLHETIHLSGNLIAQERGKDTSCTELEKELREDCKMFLKKELEYHNGKKGFAPE